MNEKREIPRAFFTDEKLREALGELEQAMGSKVDFINQGGLQIKAVVAFTLYLYSCCNSIVVLYQNNSLIAIHSLARDVLETYSKLKELFAVRKIGGDVDDLLRKFFIDDMEQDRKILNDFVNDTTTDQAQKDAAKQNYLNRLDSFLQKYFPADYHLVVQADKENSVPAAVKTIQKAYDGKYPHHNSKSVYIENALLGNGVYQSTMNRPFVDAKPIYRLLCSYTHASLGSVDELTSRDGKFTLLPAVKNIEMLMSTMYWCVRDIAYEWTQMA